jgi:nucleoside-diphosphate-sugar epimerase
MKDVILLTGANGFLGSACIDFFNRTNEYTVVAIWNNASDRLLDKTNNSIIYEQCNLLNIEQLDSLFEKYSFKSVIHTAALLPDGKPDYLSRATAVNVLATAYLVNRAVQYGINNFIYCSTTSVYGHQPCGNDGWKETSEIKPDNVYAWSKWSGEEALRVACKISSLRGLSLRLSGIHGPNRKNGVVYQMFRMAMMGKAIHINNTRDRFQLIFVAEAIDIINKWLGSISSYQTINTASHTVDSLAAMAEEIINICDSKSPIIDNKQYDNQEWVMNTDLLSKLLPYQAQPLDKRLLEIYQNMI